MFISIYVLFFQKSGCSNILPGSAELQRRKNPNERILVWKIGWVLEIADQVF